MAFSPYKSSAFVAIIWLALLFSNDQYIGKGDDDLCGSPSALFHGSCSDDKECNSLCKGTERAIKGLCQDQKCFCINKCQKPKLGGIRGSKLHESRSNDDAYRTQNPCVAPSGKFHGACFDDHACNNLYKGGEGYAGGMCWNVKCECHFKCCFKV